MDQNQKTIDEIVVVGGGDNGLLAALLLQRFNQDTQVTIIDDFEQDTTEIGKATYANVQQLFHGVLGIDRSRFFSEVKPVWKFSIYFEDWCGIKPFHIPFDHTVPSENILPNERGEEMYYRYHKNEHQTLGTELAEKQLSPFSSAGGVSGWQLFRNHAYHLSISRFNKFLRTICRERKIDLVNDEITHVETENNQIQSVSSQWATYDADLYVDATGFSRLLMENLNNSFVKFDIPLDSALVTKVNREISNIVPSTVVNSADYGWMWNIDTFDFRDLGYVYASDYVTEAEAIDEFIQAHEEEFNRSDIQKFSFDSGHLEKPWVNNCVAVGNALGFIEPLQSVTLSFSADLSKNLSEIISRHSRINYPGVRSLYNSSTESSWNELYSFISLHYIYSEGDTKFWNDVQNLKRNECLHKYVKSYREHGFHAYKEFYNDVTGPSDAWIHYLLFQNLNVESDFYEQQDVDVRQRVRQRIERKRENQVKAANEYLSYEQVVQRGVYDGDFSDRPSRQASSSLFPND